MLISLCLGLPLLALGWQASSRFAQGLLSALVVGVPAWSLMTAAVGSPVRRKLVYSLGLLTFLLTFYLIAFWTGWHQLAAGSTVVKGAEQGVLVVAYRGALVASPFVTLVLFVGREPSLLWTSRRADRMRAAP